jgi:Bacterial self-protective colicin-like immunity
MTDAEAQRAMATKVVDWLDGRIPTDRFVSEYWRVRRELLNTNWSAFDGVFGEIMSSVDTAVDSYRADDRADFEIDEQQLRQELLTAMENLRRRAPSVLNG